MKRILLLPLLLCALAHPLLHAAPPQRTTVSTAAPQAGDKAAEIKFDSISHDFGTFSGKSPVVKCTFTFTNVGNAPLIIHQAIASCGCTVPSYPKDPVKPGQTGAIEVTYNGKGKFPGAFSKTITVRTNARDTGIVRLTIKGDMTE